MYLRLRKPRGSTLALILVAVAAISASPARSSRWLQNSSGCHTKDRTDTIIVNDLKSWVPGTDSFSITNRAQWNLPQLPADSVSIVTDSTTCQRAALAYGRNLSPPDTTTARQVYVIRVGPTRFVVADPSVMAGEYLVQDVFDNTFTTGLSFVLH